MGVRNLDTSIFIILSGHHSRVTKIEPEIYWLCALGNLETWIEIFLSGHGLSSKSISYGGDKSIVFPKKIKKAILMRGVQGVWGGQIIDFFLYPGSNLRDLTLCLNI